MMYVGYRAWNPHLTDDGWRLSSLMHDFVWEGPVVDSGAKPREVEKEENYSLCITIAPDYGIFSFKNFDSLTGMLDLEDLFGCTFAGIVQPFGTVRKHELGYRSEKAQVLAISPNVTCGSVVESDLTSDIWGGDYFSWCKDDSKWFDGRYFFCDDHKKLYMKAMYYDESTEWIKIMDMVTELASVYHCDLVPLDKLETMKAKYENWKGTDNGFG